MHTTPSHLGWSGLYPDRTRVHIIFQLNDYFYFKVFKQPAWSLWCAQWAVGFKLVLIISHVPEHPTDKTHHLLSFEQIEPIRQDSEEVTKFLQGRPNSLSQYNINGRDVETSARVCHPQLLEMKTIYSFSPTTIINTRTRQHYFNSSTFGTVNLCCECQDLKLWRLYKHSVHCSTSTCTSPAYSAPSSHSTKIIGQTLATNCAWPVPHESCPWLLIQLLCFATFSSLLQPLRSDGPTWMVSIPVHPAD